MLLSGLITAVPFLALASASALPVPTWGDWYKNNCMPKSVGTEVVNQFASLLTDFSPAVANSLLAPTFTDTSGSINFLGGFPLNATTFPTPAAFVAGQGAQPPISLTILSIDAATCDGVVVFRWVAGVGSQALEVKGINVLYVTYVGGAAGDRDVVGPTGWQLETVYSEFDSGAWVVDIGGTCVSPAAQGRA